MLAAAACEIVAALAAGGILATPVLAWAFGGIAAWFLAQLP